MNNQQAGNR